MAIPDFQTLMLPLMQFIEDGQEHLVRDATDAIGKQFLLTQEEWAAMLPSGRAPLFYNRLAWAKAHLKRAGLIDQPRRGAITISARGRQVLAQSPVRINIQLLQKFPEYAALRETLPNPVGDGPVAQSELQTTTTPEESMDRAHEAIRRELVSEIISSIKACSPEFFESLVIQLLLKMGYGGSRQEAGKAVGRSGDGGIDGIINEDRLGLDAIYLQAKKWEGNVGEGPIRDFKGALDARGAQKGVFITTSSYTPAAVEAARNSGSYKIVLIDGQKLSDLMIEHDLGVSVVATYQIKRIDSDFFADE